MQLTPTQYQTLKSAIAAETDAGFVANRTAGNTGLMADFYNGNSATTAWETNVSPDTTDEACDWTQFDSITAGKRDSWIGAFMTRPRNFARNKVRKWIIDVWGAATGTNPAVAILQAGTRPARRGEMVFGGTVRATGDVSATDLNVIGTITNENIIAALGS
jgi:hypothetical protein